MREAEAKAKARILARISSLPPYSFTLSINFSNVCSHSHIPNARVDPTQSEDALLQSLSPDAPRFIGTRDAHGLATLHIGSILLSTVIVGPNSVHVYNMFIYLHICIRMCFLERKAACVYCYQRHVALGEPNDKLDSMR